MCEITSSAAARAAALELTRPIKDKFPAGVSQPALRALVREGYSALEQLVRVRESDLAKLHGMGPKALRILRDALNKQGLAFRS
jgi:DNA-directed RNA polymerase alpha subunit